MSLLELFANVPDSRRKEGKRYQLEYVLLFSVMAILGGATGYVSIARWMKAKEKELKRLFDLNWKSMPSKSRLQAIFSTIDIEELEKVLRLHSASLVKAKEGLVLAIDGKSLRGSYDTKNEVSPLNLLSVFETESNIILAHLDIENKKSEIEGVRDVIDELDFRGAICTMDALHTQKNISEPAVA